MEQDLSGSSIIKEWEKGILMQQDELHQAVEENNLERVVDICMNKKVVDVNCFKDCMTALHRACYHGFHDIVEHLLKNGVKVDHAVTEGFNEGFTPLHCAAEKNRIKCIPLLISHNAAIDAKNKKGETALFTACRHQNRKIVKLLLENGASADYGYNCKKCGKLISPIILAAEIECKKTIELLLNHDVDLNAAQGKGLTALHVAAQFGYSDLVKYLLQHGADVNAYATETCTHKLNFTPLHFATEVGCTKSMKFLLENGADVDAVDKDGTTALLIAVKSGLTRPVEVLLKNGASPDSIYISGEFRGFSALHAACKIDSLKIIKRLLENGANVNSRATGTCLDEHEDYTPLHIAAEFQTKKAVKVLMSFQADMRIKAKNGNTALHVAIKKNLSISKYLIKHGSQLHDPEIHALVVRCLAALRESSTK